MTVDTSLIDTMLAGWNTHDRGQLEQIVAASLCADIEFCDPPHHIHGHSAFIAMVEAFWADNGRCTISRTSAIDAHHDRARYSWAIDLPDGRRFEGFDAVALDGQTGKVRRVDGFFGPLKPV